MFSKVDESKKAHDQEVENTLLRAKLAKAESNVDYLSMMSGIDLPEESTAHGMETEIEGGEDNE